MKTPLKAVSVSLLAGVITLWLTACSDELPTGPAARQGVDARLTSLLPAMAPANDDFDEAVVVTELPFTHVVDTSEATTADDDPFCFGQGPTVWYQFTPSEDMRITANTFGSDYDTTLSAYLGTRGDLIQISCNDDAQGTLQSRITFDAFAGQTVHLMVGAFSSGPGGNLVFTMDIAPPPPPPLEVELTMDRFGSVDPSTGVATIRGTIACPRPASADLHGMLRTRIGRIRVEAFFSDFSTCDGVTDWEAEVAAHNAYLVAGPVEVSVSAFVFDDATFEFVFVEQSATVRLRGKRR